MERGAPLQSYNIDEARRRGEAAREAREAAEEAGTLVELPSGVRVRALPLCSAAVHALRSHADAAAQFRELQVGSRGEPAAAGARVDMLFSVFRLSPGAYFKNSGGGTPVLLFSSGYGSEGQDDVGVPYECVLGARDALPAAVAPAVVGMRAGGVRRVLVPPRLGYTSDSVRPRPPTFGAGRRLANHADEPLLFEIELVRVRPAAGAGDAAAEEALRLPDGAAAFRMPLPPALSPGGASRQARYAR